MTIYVTDLRSPVLTNTIPVTKNVTTATAFDLSEPRTYYYSPIYVPQIPDFRGTRSAESRHMTTREMKRITNAQLAQMHDAANFAYHAHVNSYGNVNVYAILNDPKTTDLREACNALYEEVLRRRLVLNEVI